MSDHASPLPGSFDPLIAEARQRAHRRRLVATIASALVVAAVAAWFVQRSTGAVQTGPSGGVTLAPRLVGSLGTSGGVSWATDQGGILWLTLDGGQTWRRVPGAALGAQQQVQFIDKRHGWIIGHRDSASPLAIDRTADGGHTWQIASLSRCACIPVLLSFYDARHGYVLATPESGNGNPSLFWTNDGGASWRLNARPRPADSIAFVNRSDGFLTTQPRPGGFPAALYRTTDGGRTWSKQAVRPPSFGGGLLVHTFGRHLVVGDWKFPPRPLRIYTSRDAGAHWTEPVLPYPAAFPILFAAGSPTMWIVATVHGMRVTHDGGQSWNTIVLHGLPQRPVALDFSSPRAGWALVGLGKLYRTTDGGRHWKPSACAAAHLTCPAGASYASQAPPHGDGRQTTHG